MSAVRMVAYGVLELKHKDPSLSSLFIRDDVHEREKAEDFERDQIRKLVNDELRRYGLLLQREVVTKGAGWRTKNNTHILYGQLVGPKGFGARPVLTNGSFKHCCEVAAKLLDELDRSQELGT